MRYRPHNFFKSTYENKQNLAYKVTLKM